MWILTTVGLRALPQAGVGFSAVEEPVVFEFLQTGEEIAQPAIRFRIAPQNFDEPFERRFPDLSGVESGIAPPRLDEALFDGSADTVGLHVAEFGIDRREDVPERARDVQMRHSGFPVHDLQRVEPQTVEVDESHPIARVIESFVDILMIRKDDRPDMRGGDHLFADVQQTGGFAHAGQSGNQKMGVGPDGQRPAHFGIGQRVRAETDRGHVVSGVVGAFLRDARLLGRRTVAGRPGGRPRISGVVGARGIGRRECTNCGFPLRWFRKDRRRSSTEIGVGQQTGAEQEHPRIITGRNEVQRFDARIFRAEHPSSVALLSRRQSVASPLLDHPVYFGRDLCVAFPG